MKVEIFPDADTVAQKAAAIVAAEVRGAVAARGRFILAVSGGPHPLRKAAGLAPEGPFALVVPGVPFLNVADEEVALTGVYRGRRGMAWTYPTLTPARRILWLVTGMDKVAALARLRAGDVTIPAGRIQRTEALV